jgi:hypothetical protein
VDDAAQRLGEVVEGARSRAVLGAGYEQGRALARG